jgi:PBP1b-binding outer membrane lipoprotein LpoB
MKYSILLIFTTLLIAACTPQPAGQVAETDNKSEEVVQEASRTASATPTAQGAPINAAQEFSTAFSISSIDFGEILS